MGQANHDKNRAADDQYGSIATLRDPRSLPLIPKSGAIADMVPPTLRARNGRTAVQQTEAQPLLRLEAVA